MRKLLQILMLFMTLNLNAQTLTSPPIIVNEEAGYNGWCEGDPISFDLPEGSFSHPTLNEFIVNFYYKIQPETEWRLLSTSIGTNINDFILPFGLVDFQYGIQWIRPDGTYTNETKAPTWTTIWVDKCNLVTVVDTLIITDTIVLPSDTLISYIFDTVYLTEFVDLTDYILADSLQGVIDSLSNLEPDTTFIIVDNTEQLDSLQNVINDYEQELADCQDSLMLCNDEVFYLTNELEDCEDSLEDCIDNPTIITVANQSLDCACYMSLYPNPVRVNSTFTIQAITPDNVDIVQYIILDMQGVTVDSGVLFQDGKFFTELLTSPDVVGTYIVLLTFKNNGTTYNITEELIVE